VKEFLKEKNATTVASKEVEEAPKTGCFFMLV
jgi:hypothetical protein